MQPGSIRWTAMLGRTRRPTEALRRVLENAGILIFASLFVMSLVLGRYTGALVWCGALLVFFAQAWEGRTGPRRAADAAAPPDGSARPRRYDVLRWLGVTLSLAGAAAIAL